MSASLDDKREFLGILYRHGGVTLPPQSVLQHFEQAMELIYGKDDASLLDAVEEAKEIRRKLTSK